MGAESTQKYPQELLDLVSDIIADMTLPKFLANKLDRESSILDAVRAKDADLDSEIIVAVSLVFNFELDFNLDERSRLRLKIYINDYLENLVKQEQAFYAGQDEKRESEASLAIEQHEAYVDAYTTDALTETADFIKEYQLGMDVIRLEALLKAIFGLSFADLKAAEKECLIENGGYDEEAGDTGLFNPTPDLATKKLELMMALYMKQKDVFTSGCEKILEGSNISAKDKQVITKLRDELVAIIDKNYLQNPEATQKALAEKIASKDFQKELKKCDKSIGRKFMELLAKIFTLGFKKSSMANSAKFTNTLNSTVTMYAELSKATSHKVDEDSEVASEKTPGCIFQ